MCQKRNKQTQNKTPLEAEYVKSPHKSVIILFSALPRTEKHYWKQWLSKYLTFQPLYDLIMSIIQYNNFFFFFRFFAYKKCCENGLFKFRTACILAWESLCSGHLLIWGSVFTCAERTVAHMGSLDCSGFGLDGRNCTGSRGVFSCKISY